MPDSSGGAVIYVDISARDSEFRSVMGRVSAESKRTFQEVRQAASTSMSNFTWTGLPGQSGLKSVIEETKNLESANVDVRHSFGLLDNAIRGNHAAAVTDLIRLNQNSAIVMKALPFVATAGGAILAAGAIFEMAKKTKEYWESLAALSEQEQKLFDESTKNAREKLDLETESIKAEYELQIAKADGIEKDRLRVEEAASLVKFNKEYVGQLITEKTHLEDLRRQQEGTRQAAEKQIITPSLGGEDSVDLFALYKERETAQRIEGTDKALKALDPTIQRANNALKQAQAHAIDTGKSFGTHLADGVKKARTELEKFIEASRGIIEYRAVRGAGAGLPTPDVSAADPTGQFRGLIGAGDILSKIPPSSAPLYSGSAEAMSLEKIKGDQEAAIQAAQRVTQALGGENQKWNEQYAILVELYNQGRLTDAEFTKGMQQVQAGLLKTDSNWKDFGSHVGSTLEQAALFGRKWQDALKAIAIETTELILKMTLLKKLQGAGGGSGGSGSGGGGIGGFLSGLLGGFTGGHATGGEIGPGQWGIVGERGPEPVFGGVRGMTVFPNSTLRGGGGGDQYHFHIDARGADEAAVEMRVRRAVQAAHAQAVSSAMKAQNEYIKRTPRGGRGM